MAERVYLDLSQALPDGPEPTFDREGPDAYYIREREVLSPALEAAGYTLHRGWYTGEGDSFGPLSRCIDTDRGTVWYG